MLAALTFEFYRFRFQFRAAGTLYFPPYKSCNTLRGAFGTIFRKQVCLPECTGAKVCDVRTTCPYARIFEPQAARGEGPSGLADWPRPFVFRASHLDGNTIQRGEPFHFDIHIFDTSHPALEHFVQAFAQLAEAGLGPGRNRADLVAVDQLDLHGTTPTRVYEGPGNLDPPIAVDLDPPADSVSGVRLRFVTPTELKNARRPDFGILFSRLRDRISTMRMLYGSGPLEIDFQAMGERAAAVQLTRCDLKMVEADRLSSRSGRRHTLGGFVGVAEYEGDLGEFTAYLQLGKWVGVGRQTVWGKGEFLTVTLR